MLFVNTNISVVFIDRTLQLLFNNLLRQNGSTCYSSEYVVLCRVICYIIRYECSKNGQFRVFPRQGKPQIPRQPANSAARRENPAGPGHNCWKISILARSVDWRGDICWLYSFLFITVLFFVNYPVYPAPGRGDGVLFSSDFFLSFFVYLFRVTVSNIARKRLDRFTWNFQGRCGVTMGRPGYI